MSLPSGFPRGEADVKRVQISRSTRKAASPVEIDTRTPSGRVLPY